MSENNYSIYICGVGGQGIIKTSTIIGEAVMNEGYNVVMSEIHGMSQRGGSVSTELKIGDFKSSILENHTADMILGFEPSEVIRGLHKANKDTYLVFNTTPVVPAQLASSKQSYPNVDSMINALKQNFNNVHPVDGNAYAKEAGSILSLNMALLGSAVAVKSFPISKDLVIDAMKNNLKEKFHKMNIKAFELGYNAVR
ncbi:MAG: indolepyruvate oxidoreductase subunit beta [Methanobrevibacter sp.]